MIASPCKYDLSTGALVPLIYMASLKSGLSMVFWVTKIPITSKLLMLSAFWFLAFHLTIVAKRFIAVLIGRATSFALIRFAFSLFAFFYEGIFGFNQIIYSYFGVFGFSNIY